MTMRKDGVWCISVAQRQRNKCSRRSCVLCCTLSFIPIILSGMQLREQSRNILSNIFSRKRKLFFRKVSEGDNGNGVATNDNSRYVFKILQLADLHFGEAESTDWGPMQDVKSKHAIQSVLKSEQDVDLVILSGDQLTANNIDRNATTYYRQLLSILVESGVKNWAMIFGNHDDMPLETKLDNGTIIYTASKTSRKELVELDISYPQSWTQTTHNLFGVSNYEIPLYLDHGGSRNVAADIFMFDSGGGSLPEEIQDNQMNWFRKQATKASAHHYELPIVAFEHIPSNGKFLYNSNVCTGTNGDGDTIDTLDYDAGILDALSSHGQVHFVAVGHMHGNSYCCKYDNAPLHLCFGRHSGYGGYGSFDRGARVYQLEFVEKKGTTADIDQSALDSNLKFSWRSWVRLESGEKIDEFEPDQ